MDDYENHFYEQESKGKSEKDIISDLREPHDISNSSSFKKVILSIISLTFLIELSLSYRKVAYFEVHCKSITFWDMMR
jgi:hypothetical protein